MNASIIVGKVYTVCAAVKKIYIYYRYVKEAYELQKSFLFL